VARSLKELLPIAAIGLMACYTTSCHVNQPETLKINWEEVIVTSKSTPTLQVVVNPMLLRGARLHDSSFAALHVLGADYVRYVPWLPYPRLAVAELSAPEEGKTSWDFAHIDPVVDDFMKATEGHSVVVDFSTMPAWMFKTDKTVAFPDDPNQVFWDYTQGTELRDPTMLEAANYFARLLSWYTQGGFTDEMGKCHESGHHYKIAYWEVLNEIDLEHKWTPQQYTKFYDVVTVAMRKVDPNIKFMAAALAQPSKAPAMFEYFLNPANHQANVPLDFIAYHFYATSTPKQTISNWQYNFFNQVDGFLNTVRFVEEIRKRYSPSTKTDLDELGVILPEDDKEIRQPGYVAKPEPAEYWNLAAATYAYLYVELAKLGIDVVGESQLVGYKSQFPSVSMVNYETGDPNPRLWVLKLLKDNLGPGDQLVETTLNSPNVTVQAFATKEGKKLLAINKRDRPQDLVLPPDAAGSTVSLVAPSSRDHAAIEERLEGTTLHLEPFEVAVVRWK
jgi:hypothetical protein